MFGVVGQTSINIQLFFFSFFHSPCHYCILPLCCCPSFHHSPRACTRHQRKSADPRRRKTFHPQPICCHISICRYKYKSRCFKERHLFGVAIIEPLPFGHAVKFALARSFQIWDPVVVLSLKKLLVVLGTLFLPAKNNICLSLLSLYIWLSFSV